MSDLNEEAEALRLEGLLIQALQQAEIPQRDQTNWLPPFLGGTTVYWQKQGNEIEIVFNSAKFSGGRIQCSIYLERLVGFNSKHRNENEHLIEVVDILRYLRMVVSQILPDLENHLSARSLNSLPRKMQRIIRGIGYPFASEVRQALDTKRKEAVTRLRADREKRGGSDPRLPDEQRKSLHAQYDALHRACKTIKRDYESKLKRFAKDRKAKGYSRKEWRAHWMKGAKDYPDEIRELIGLFVQQDSPSASEVAYTVLAKRTGHARSYIPRLIAKSRKDDQDRPKHG